MPTKQEVEARLQRLGAFYVMDMADLHQPWATGWGFFVWVPLAGPNHTDLDEEGVLEIEDDIRSPKPRP